jgi:type II secretory pathway pseudopilin PulG
MSRFRLTRFARSRRHGGFMLLEVIVSLVILGISVATLMRSFQLSLSAIRKNDVTTVACVLGDRLMQDFELNPPQSSVTSGDFSEDGYPNYSWTAKYKEEPIRYRGLKTKNKVDDLRGFKHVTVEIIYDDKRLRRYSPVQLDLYLPPIERFSPESKFRNELFLEEGST